MQVEENFIWGPDKTKESVMLDCTSFTAHNPPLVA